MMKKCLLAFASFPQVKATKCLGTARQLKLSPSATTISFRFPPNTLTFCQQHRQNSCCPRNLTDKIKHRVRDVQVLDDSAIDDHWHRGLSLHCLDMTGQAYCAACDALAGRAAQIVDYTNKTILTVRPDRSVPICESFCIKWFNACQSSYFSTVDGQLRPCDPSEALICWQGHLIQSYQKFCEDSGFSVINKDDRNYCYDGYRLGSDLLGSGQELPKEWKQLARKLEDVLLSAADRIEWYWRRANGMVLWLSFIVIVWLITWKKRLDQKLGVADDNEL